MRKDRLKIKLIQENSVKLLNDVEKGIKKCCLPVLPGQELGCIKGFAGSQLRADRRRELTDDAQRNSRVSCIACCKHRHCTLSR